MVLLDLVVLRGFVRYNFLDFAVGSWCVCLGLVAVLNLDSGFGGLSGAADLGFGLQCSSGLRGVLVGHALGRSW